MPKQDPSPTAEQIALLVPFERLELDRILVISTREEVALAFAELSLNRVLGFDTESKPTFTKGEFSDGPHVVQFSTPERAYIFQLHQTDCHQAVAALIESAKITKVGFGLASDHREISRKLNIRPREVLDLNTVFKRHGFRKSVGVKGAVAVALQRRFMKSKKAATSNWANRRLTEKQILYAANDAYAAIQVFNVLGRLNPAPDSYHEETRKVEF